MSRTGDISSGWMKRLADIMLMRWNCRITCRPHHGRRSADEVVYAGGGHFVVKYRLLVM